jgi:alkylhydroperoxidase/carboxymuconolactone decarboxylase family protein YurZ
MESKLDQNVVTLRNLASNVDRLADCPTSTLDPKTDALIRIGAFIALGAAPTCYLGAIRVALDVGASADEIVGALVSVCATVGTVRVVSASGAVAVALGYDIDAAFEEH